MKKLLVLIIALLLEGNGFGDVPDADFYISPKGSDRWSGTLSEPNKQGSDGPFATLARARDAVRELKRRTSKDMLVLIREGRYQLDETVVFGLEDSGQAGASITYAAYPNETPVFSSGQVIKGWKKAPLTLPHLTKEARGKVWLADLPKVNGHARRFYTLYDDQGLLPRARSASGFIPSGNKNMLTFPKGQLKNWPNIEDVELFVRPYQAWIVNILPLKSVDGKKCKAWTSISATYPMNELHYALKGEVGCWVENVLEELDAPGEWVLNTREGKLYLWPRSKSPVMAPQLMELIRVEGDIDLEGPTDVPVQYLRFIGLTFMHGDRYSLAPDDAGLQHDWDMFDKDNALVRLRGAENCTVEACHFLHSGSGAIRVDLYGRHNQLSDNHIEYMGGGGILLCGYGPGKKDVNTDNLVYNNNIHHVGRIYWHSPGIFIWQSGNNRVANNLIHHTPYSALIVSGCMTEFFSKWSSRELVPTIRRQDLKHLPDNPTLDDIRPYLHSHGNLIELNEIHHAMEKLADGNGIYIRGAGPGNVIRRNYIHDLVAPTIMQAAIRTDGGQRDTLIAENLIYNCRAQGIVIKQNNRCENNFIVNIIGPPRGDYVVLREGPMAGATLKRNILYSTEKPEAFIDEMDPKGKRTEDRRGQEIARSEDVDGDYNIYYCVADPELGKKALKKQKAKGVDANSRAIDPLFVAPENGDFRLKSKSPALKMGILPINQSSMGLRKHK